MSVTCQKEYSVSIIGAPPVTAQAWWAFEAVYPVADYVDSIGGFLTTPHAAFLGTLFTTTGRIGNGLGITGAAGLGPLRPNTGPAFVAATSSGLSYWCWLHVDAGFKGQIQIGTEQTDANNSLYLEMSFNDGRQCFVFDSNNTVHNFGLNLFPDGVWFFTGLTWNKATGLVSVYLNGASIFSYVMAPNTPPDDQMMSCFVSYARNENPGFPPTAAWIVDEFGVNVTKAVSASDMVYLYNGGAGKTWPL